MNWITFIVSAAIGQGIILTVLLLSKKSETRRPRILLALLIGSFSISLLHLFPYWNSEIHEVLTPLRLGEPFQFLCGPLIYLYTLTMSQGKGERNAARILHFLPFLLAIATLYTYLGIGSTEPRNVFVFSIVMGGALVIQLCVYSFVIHRILSECRNQLKRGYSSLDQVGLQWLNLIMGALLFLTLLDVLLFSHLLHNFYMHWMDIAVPLLLSVILFLLGYKGLLQPDIFYALSTKSSVPQEKVLRYSKSALSWDNKKEIQERLEELMEREKPHLQPGLTLADLSELSGISRNHLSQVINENLGMNFHDYINAARISVVIDALEANLHQHQTLLAIALDAGFSSKATFNGAFKKHTGKTPSQYIKTLNLPMRNKD